MKKHINVQVTPELHQEVKEVIPRGLVGYLYQSILRLVLDAIREDGQVVLGAILAGDYKLSLARSAPTDPNRNSIKASGHEQA